MLKTYCQEVHVAKQSFGSASLYLLRLRSNVGCLQRGSQITNALSKETNDPCKAQCCFSKAMSTYSKCRDLLDVCSENGERGQNEGWAESSLLFAV